MLLLIIINISSLTLSYNYYSQNFSLFFHNFNEILQFLFLIIDKIILKILGITKSHKSGERIKKSYVIRIYQSCPKNSFHDLIPNPRIKVLQRDLKVILIVAVAMVTAAAHSCSTACDPQDGRTDSSIRRALSVYHLPSPSACRLHKQSLHVLLRIRLHGHPEILTVLQIAPTKV